MTDIRHVDRRWLFDDFDCKSSFHFAMRAEDNGFAPDEACRITAAEASSMRGVATRRQQGPRDRAVNTGTSPALPAIRADCMRDLVPDSTGSLFGFVLGRGSFANERRSSMELLSAE